jgi:hypothetical protein
VYKAGTIMKSLKAGEVPVRGNPFEPEEEKQNSTVPEPAQEHQQEYHNQEYNPNAQDQYAY